MYKKNLYIYLSNSWTINLSIYSGTAKRAVEQAIEAGLANVDWMDSNYEVNIFPHLKRTVHT